jgi:hypothetical protein
MQPSGRPKEVTLHPHTTRDADTAQAAADLRAADTNSATKSVLGLLLDLPDPCDCGCTTALIGPGGAKHPASVICESCQAHRGWASRSMHRFITEVVAHFGRLTTPITVRRAASFISDNTASSSLKGMARELPTIRNLTECAPAAPPAHDEH